MQCASLCNHVQLSAFEKWATFCNFALTVAQNPIFLTSSRQNGLLTRRAFSVSLQRHLFKGIETLADRWAGAWQKVQPRGFRVTLCGSCMPSMKTFYDFEGLFLHFTNQ